MIATAAVVLTIGLVCFLQQLGEVLQALLIIMTLGAIGYYNWRRKLRLGIFISCISASFAIAFIIGLAGFYQHSYPVAFDAGGTWVADRSVGTAVASGLFTPSTFTATFFGYSCNTTYGANCSQTAYYTGVVVVQALLGAGLIAGNILTVWSGKRPYLTS